MIKYFLSLTLLTTFSLFAQSEYMTNNVDKNVTKDKIIVEAKPDKEQSIEVLDTKMKKSTLDVEVIKYAIPNNSEVSFPVTVRKNSLVEDE